MNNVPRARSRLHRLSAILAFAVAVLVTGAALPAAAGCDRDKIEQFLGDRAFNLSADQKIVLYADEVYRYYGRSDLGVADVLQSMRNWERRWPERDYEYLDIVDFEEADSKDACKVVFDYRFLAHNPGTQRTSAGIGRTTMVIAETGPQRTLKIVGEWGDVLCRGMRHFTRKSC